MSNKVFSLKNKLVFFVLLYAVLFAVYFVTARFYGYRGFDSESVIFTAVSPLTLIPLFFKAPIASFIHTAVYYLALVAGEIASLYTYNPETAHGGVRLPYAIIGFAIGAAAAVTAEAFYRKETK